MKLKRLCAMLLAFSALVTAATLPVSAETAAGLDAFVRRKTYTDGQFADVAYDSWYADNVAAVYEYGLMIGREDDRFVPDGVVTTAEAITLVARLHKLYYTGDDEFEASTPWHKSYVDYAAANGLTIIWQSDAALQEELDEPAPRNTVALLMTLALPKEVFEPINEVEFGAILDVWTFLSFDHIYTLYRAGILGGKDAARNFGMNDPITRSEIAAIMTRTVEPELRLSFTLTKPEYPPKNEWYQPGKYAVGAEIPSALYYVVPLSADTPASYSITRVDSSGRESPVTSNGGIVTYDFIYVHNSEFFDLKNGKAILATNIPPLVPEDGRYTSGKYRIGTDIPAGEYKIYTDTEGVLATYTVFSASRGHGQGGLLDRSTVVDFFVWKEGYREVTLREGGILELSGSHIDT